MILALETATNVCSVAFFDGVSIHERRIEKRGSHSEKLFLFIEQLQQEYHFKIPDLDAVLVSEGPGSYTGLRIAASAVKGLLFETGVTLYGINTLASFAFEAAQKVPDSKAIHSIIDARRVHLYHQKFNHNGGKISSDDEVSITPIEEVESMISQNDVVIGTGLDRIDKEVLSKAKCFGSEVISAKSLINLYLNEQDVFYHSVDIEAFDPKYYTSNQVQK